MLSIWSKQPRPPFLALAACSAAALCGVQEKQRLCLVAFSDRRVDAGLLWLRQRGQELGHGYREDQGDRDGRCSGTLTTRLRQRQARDRNRDDRCKTAAVSRDGRCKDATASRDGR